MYSNLLQSMHGQLNILHIKLIHWCVVVFLANNSNRLVGLVDLGIAPLDTNYKQVHLILLGSRHDQECIWYKLLTQHCVDVFLACMADSTLDLVSVVKSQLGIPNNPIP